MILGIKTRLLRILLISGIFWVSGSLICFGQELEKSDRKSVHTFLTSRYHFGLVVPHYGFRSNMMYFLDDYARGVEINYGRVGYGKSNWEQYFNYPEIGLGFFYGTFGNKEIYGKGLALFPYVNYKILQIPRFVSQAKVSMGLGYATKPFDLEDNNYNMALGSHLNIYIGLGLIFDYRIAERFSITVSGALNHMSNGSVKNPNNGINLATLSLGTKYHFNGDAYARVIKKKPNGSNGKEIIINGNIGRNQRPNINSGSLWSGSLNVSHLWYVNNKKALGVGLDFLYYGGAPYSFLGDKVGYNTEFADFYYSGVFVSYNVLMGRTIIYTHLGTYIHYKNKPDQRFYPRIGIRYNITKKFLVNYSLKAGFLRAEFMEFGIGYRFQYKKNSKS